MQPTDVPGLGTEARRTPRHALTALVSAAVVLLGSLLSPTAAAATTAGGRIAPPVPTAGSATSTAGTQARTASRGQPGVRPALATGGGLAVTPAGRTAGTDGSDAPQPGDLPARPARPAATATDPVETPPADRGPAALTPPARGRAPPAAAAVLAAHPQ